MRAGAGVSMKERKSEREREGTMMGCCLPPVGSLPLEAVQLPAIYADVRSTMYADRCHRSKALMLAVLNAPGTADTSASARGPLQGGGWLATPLADDMHTQMTQRWMTLGVCNAAHNRRRV